MNQKLTIVIIEDYFELGQAYKKCLEAENFKVLHFVNEEDALAQIMVIHPDMVILDLLLPKISGFDILDILRNTNQTAHLPVIVLSALSDAKDKLKAIGLGADLYLVKSQVNSGEIINKVKQLLVKSIT